LWPLTIRRKNCNEHTCPSRPHRCDGTSARLSPRPAFTQAHSQNCSTKKRMSARADFAGARYCAHKVTVRLKNMEFFQKPGGWCNRLRKATESNRRKPVPNGILPRVPSSIRPPEEVVSRGFGLRGMASLLVRCGCSTQDAERLGIMLRPWKNLATCRLSDTDDRLCRLAR
jgi:hypothetical protein